MARSIFAFISALLLMMLFLSCTKHKDDFISTIPHSTISFSNPTENGIYYSGDSISIQAKAISEKTIHGYDLRITKANDTATLYFKNVHDHNDTLVVDTKWKNTITDASSLEASITLHIDHDGNTNTKKVRFTSRVR